ncbi:MAG: tRNA pseudouridine(55) synthase TruB [Patescibacteria group bacterium]
MPEILLIDKPKGITSFDVIRRVRKQIGIKKIGHAGTLDPLATGLMILGVGPGTKQLTNLIKLDKDYTAEILIGESRSTGDMEGEVITSVTEVTLDPAHILVAVAGLVGTISLPVSAYSAIKKDGVPMYKRARAAEKVGSVVTDLPVRDMVVHGATVEHIEVVFADASMKTISRVLVTVNFSVGSGTYIRSLAEELGRRLGYPATLANLRRTRVGEYKIEDAQKIEDLKVI